MGSMVQIEGERISPSPGFEDILEIVSAAEATAPPASASPARLILETRYIEPVASETYKEYISPTIISNASSSPGRSVEIDEDDVAREEDPGKGDQGRAMGLFAHKVMETVGNGCRLEELVKVVSNETLGGLYDLPPAGLGEADFQELLRHLGRLKDHPLIKEMESALESMNEYQIIRPFGRYILSGRPDKVIKTAEGWKILDFKFSSSERHSEAYEFQTRFYLYIAQEIFSPMLGAELFYLKDGVSVKVRLDEDSVREFENDLIRRIEEYQSKYHRNSDKIQG